MFRRHAHLRASRFVRSKEPRSSRVLRTVRPLTMLAILTLSAVSLSSGVPKIRDSTPAPHRLCPSSPVDHSGDAPEVAKLKALMRGVVYANTVIVIPVNSGFLKLALNLRCRLLNLGSTNFVFWALDSKVAAFLGRRGLRFYFDPKLYSIPEGTGYNDPRYIRMMSERPRVWWRMAATGYDILFLDSDVVAFDQPERAFNRRLADFEAQIDGYRGWDFTQAKSNQSDVCAGAFWMRSSKKTLCLMDLLIDSYRQHEAARAQLEHTDGDKSTLNRWDDQIALNSATHNPEYSVVINRGLPPGQRVRTDFPPSMLRVRFVPASQILAGHLMKHMQVVGSGYAAGFKAESHGIKQTLRPVMLHINGFYFGTKTRCLKDNGWWELNKTLHCTGGEGWALRRPGWGQLSQREREDRQRRRLIRGDKQRQEMERKQREREQVERERIQKKRDQDDKDEDWTKAEDAGDLAMLVEAELSKDERGAGGERAHQMDGEGEEKDGGQGSTQMLSSRRGAERSRAQGEEETQGLDSGNLERLVNAELRSLDRDGMQDDDWGL